MVRNDIDYPASEEAFYIHIDGDAARAIYATLTVAEVTEGFPQLGKLPAPGETAPPPSTGPASYVGKKNGKEIRCTTIYPNQTTTSCETVLDWAGQAHAPK